MATKGTREAQRQTILVQELQKVASLITTSFPLPLNPAMLVSGLDIEVRGRGILWTGEEGRDGLNLHVEFLWTGEERKGWTEPVHCLV